MRCQPRHEESCSPGEAAPQSGVGAAAASPPSIIPHSLRTQICSAGIRGKCPHGLKCWLYFPEDDCPFYRTTVFSHYAAKNCPEGGSKLPTLCLANGEDPASGEAAEGPYWSLMFEISESQYKPVSMKDTKLGGSAGVGRGRGCERGGEIPVTRGGLG